MIRRSPFSVGLQSALVVGLVVIALLLATAAPGSTRSPASQDDPAVAASAPRPNIVLITTDDQSLADMSFMPLTRQVIGASGVTFANGIANHPLCCPSRAEILTGQYAQNNGVTSNTGTLGGYRALRDPHNTIATWLNYGGYQTGFIGKFLNLYKPTLTQPRGWDLFEPYIDGTYSAFDYVTQRGSEAIPPDGVTHSNDYLARRTDELITAWSGADKPPFFIWASYVSPHGSCGLNNAFDNCSAPPTPAERHSALYPNLSNRSEKKPSYMERNVLDKPAMIRDLERIGPDDLRVLARARAQSLASVDEAVASTVAALATAGELENTYLIFTSDNGYLLGEHRFSGKVVPYAESLRVPFLLRGPGIPAGVRRPQRVATIDIAPTIAAMARVKPRREVDGASMLPAAIANRKKRRTVLIQAGAPFQTLTNQWKYRGVFTGRYTFASWLKPKELELYDNRLDPFQLTNVAGKPRYRAVLRELQARTDQLSVCAGEACRVTFDKLPTLPRRKR